MLALAAFVGIRAGIDFVNGQEEHHVDRGAGFEITVPERWVAPGTDAEQLAVASLGSNIGPSTKVSFVRGKDSEQMIALVATTPNANGAVQVDQQMIEQALAAVRSRDPEGTATLASVDGTPAVQLHFSATAAGEQGEVTMLIVPDRGRTFVVEVVDGADHERTAKVKEILDSFHLLNG